MTLDATDSSFALDEIVAFKSSDVEQAAVARMTQQGINNKLTLFDVAANDDFTFTLTGSHSGFFALSIVCASDAVCVQIVRLLEPASATF